MMLMRLAKSAASLNNAIRIGATLTANPTSSTLGGIRLSHGGKKETPAEFDKRFVAYFNREEIDGWEVRKGLQDLHMEDVIPEPEIVKAVLRACRRVNDYALAVRFLEAIKIKCGSKKNVDYIYGYIIKEVKPTLEELGIETPEELGYDKPELFIPSPEWWWERSWYKEYGFDKKPGYEY